MRHGVFSCNAWTSLLWQRGLFPACARWARIAAKAEGVYHCLEQCRLLFNDVPLLGEGRLGVADSQVSPNAEEKVDAVRSAAERHLKAVAAVSVASMLVAL